MSMQGCSSDVGERGSTLTINRALSQLRNVGLVVYPAEPVMKRDTTVKKETPPMKFKIFAGSGSDNHYNLCKLQMRITAQWEG
jgi:hypothetical protein